VAHDEVLQHVPSTQNPLTHSLPALQPCPSFFLQLPDASQVLVPVQVSGSSAESTGVQLPEPEPALLPGSQRLHVPQDAALQQTPSTQ